MQLYSTVTRKPIVLGREIARGGEGAIHLLPDDPGRAVKRYLASPSPEKQQKLRAMPAAATDDLLRVAAWPVELLTLRASDGPGQAVGFIMPKVASADQLHEIYTPKSRAQAFPDADLRFIVHVAANVVRAFGTVHAVGHVIGDVNHGHVLVGADGRVTLIDCDSFQISVGGQQFTCDVGVPLFTAPELQGRNFRGLVRTANHDRFGLAVLLFHLLYMGRHPYAGVPLDPSQSAEIEPAIRAGRFAYGARRRSMNVEQPPGTIPLDTFGPGIAALFEAAFAHPTNDRRPDEATWLAALLALQSSLKPCRRSPSHQYPGQLAACPWCAVETRTGVRLFGTKLQGAGITGEIDAATLWRAIVAVPTPASVTEVDISDCKARNRTPEERRRQTRRSIRRVGAIVVALAILIAFISADEVGWGFAGGCALAFFAWPRRDSALASTALSAVNQADRTYKALQDEWRRTATEANFIALRDQLEKARAELDALPRERAARLAELTSPASQQEAYLDRFRIARERVPGIGAGRAATLASFGIETAADVTLTKIVAIPGFGPSLASKLVAWREDHLARFRYDPAQKPPPADVRAIEADILARRRSLIGALQTGPSTLARANGEAAMARQRLTPVIQARFVELLNARRALAEA